MLLNVVGPPRVVWDLGIYWGVRAKQVPGNEDNGAHRAVPARPKGESEGGMGWGAQAAAGGIKTASLMIGLTEKPRHTL